MAPTTYTTYEAAQITGVDESTIRRQCADGRLPGAFRQVQRSREVWVIPMADLAAVHSTKKRRRRK
jgi:predicted site-specific integrase-resolvase